jgi:hypothetical protein
LAGFHQKYLPMYNHAWTDGRGNCFLRGRDDGTLPVANASEWRQLKIIHRNDPGYRPLPQPRGGRPS